MKQTIMLLTALVVLGGAVVFTRASVTGPSTPLSPETARLIDSIDGAALYQAYCAVCHGADGRGNGPMASALRTPPSDLTRIAAHHGGAFPAKEVAGIISGGQAVPGHGTRAMPVWGPIFSQVAWDQDLGQMRIHNLTEYLGKIQKR